MEIKEQILALVPRLYGSLSEEGISYIDELIGARVDDYDKLTDIAFKLASCVIPKNTQEQMCMMDLMNISVGLPPRTLGFDMPMSQPHIPDSQPHLPEIDTQPDDDDTEQADQPITRTFIVTYDGDADQLRMTNELAYLLSDDEYDVFYSLSRELQQAIQEYAREGIVITANGIFAIPQQLDAESDVFGYAFTQDDVIKICGSLDYECMISRILQMDTIISELREYLE